MKKSSIVAAIATGLVLLTIAVSSIVSNRKLAGQVAAQKQFIEQREALIDSLHAELFIANVKRLLLSIFNVYKWGSR